MLEATKIHGCLYPRAILKMASVLDSQVVCQRFLFVFTVLCGAQRLHPQLRVKQATDSHVFRVSCKFYKEAFPVGLLLHDLHLSIRLVSVCLSSLLHLTGLGPQLLVLPVLGQELGGPARWHGAVPLCRGSGQG